MPDAEDDVEIAPTARAHPMVLAAQARLAREGGWERIARGTPLEGHDLIDAELLEAAGILQRRGPGFRVARPEFAHHDPPALAAGNIALLRRALRYAEGAGLGWSGEDADVVRAQGRSSAVVADMLAEQLAAMPGPREAFASGRGRFLDVGVGVAAISLRLCELYPGATAVGIDVLGDVLRIAREEVTAHGMTDRVELRRQDVAALADQDAFDLAWLPQPFVPPDALEAGVVRVLEALRPDGWLVMPLQCPVEVDPFHEALSVHVSHVLGGGPMTRDEAELLLKESGYVDVGFEEYHGLALVLARRA